MNHKESQMPILDGIAAEKRRRAYEADAAALLAKSDELLKRLDKLGLMIKRMTLETKDDPDNHLHPCKCGRQFTRFDECMICYGEGL